MPSKQHERILNMADDLEQQEWFKFGMAATLAKQYAADQRVFLERLAKMLESALPDATEIGKHGGLFARKTVNRVTVTFGEDRYTLEDEGRGPLRATRIHVVRGIALKTEELPVAGWLQELGALLDEQARQSQQAREALARLVD